jgi:guanylate kinase
MKQGMIIVVAPSGAGKTTFLERLIKEVKGLEDTVTYTTRAPRVGESEGNPYHFVSNEKFESLIRENFFVEWAKVHDKYYGTPEYQIRETWERGHAVIMDVDIQGATTFKQKFPQAKSIFIQPPSIDALRQRLAGRAGGPPKDLDLRLQNAQKEMARAHECDYQIINDQFEESYGRFKKLVEEILYKD